MSNSILKPPAHPGIYLKQSVIPANLSVKRLAEMLGVGRPALSRLLNGNAALSSRMAMRFEKAFKVDRTDLLQMQTLYEDFKAQKNEHQIAVRASIPPFLEITARQITTWSENTVNARTQLPALVRRLVNTTGKNLEKVDFPAYDNGQRKGWDGVVHSGAATPWIPLGKSGWELSCNQNHQRKATADYETRTEGFRAHERKTTTFVFVTTRNWPGKEQWAEEKRNQGKWKDVRTFDASDLEQWLEQSIPAQTYFVGLLGYQSCHAKPPKSLDEIRDIWAKATDPKLSPKLFAPAAKRHRKVLKKWLSEPPSQPFVVAATSYLEGLAFVVCALKRVHKPFPATFDRSVVVQSLEEFRSIPKGFTNFLLVIASPEVEQNLAGLQKLTHTIIVRGHRHSTLIRRPEVALGPLRCEDFRKALKHMGVSDQRIRRLARQSARYPTILRRRLASTPGVGCPPWSEDAGIARSLIPLALVGAWESTAKDDQEVLRCVTRSDEYDEIEEVVAANLQRDEPQIWSAGSHRGVVSKLDVLDGVHRFVTKAHVEDFLTVAEIVLSEDDPTLELPEDKRWAASLYGISRQYSSALRESVCDTLVLMAVRGNTFFDDGLGMDVERKVERVVRRLLEQPTASKWLSLRNELSYLAEAAPRAFLKVLQQDLESQTPAISTLLEPVGNEFFRDCPRTELLWGLELLAWNPQCLPDVVRILARLCEYEINDNWANKPLRSMESIFRFRMPQTAATLGERTRALRMLMKDSPEICWRICVRQFYPVSTVALDNHRPLWRTDADETDGDASTSKLEDAARQVLIEIALNWSSHNAHTLGDLVERLAGLSSDQRNCVWEQIHAWCGTEPDDTEKVVLRERIREHVLTHNGQRRFKDEVSNAQARDVFALLEPSDPVVRHRWLFGTQWPDASAGEIEDVEIDYAKREKQVAVRREKALLEIWKEAGQQGVLDSCRSSDDPSIIGSSLALISSLRDPVVDAIPKFLSVSEPDLQHKLDRCVTGFLGKLDQQKRQDTLLKLLDHLAGQEQFCIRLLRCAPFRGETWHLVDGLGANLKQQYWKEVDPRFGRFSAYEITKFVDELLAVNRTGAAFEAAHLHWKLMDSHRLVYLLNRIGTEESEFPRKYSRDSYYVSEALEVLDDRFDISRDVIAWLELLFIESLDNTERGIPKLEVRLSRDPELFAQALVLAFKRNDGGEDPPEGRSSSVAKRLARRTAAYSLLTNASRVPGTQADGSIKLSELETWLGQARELSRQLGRANTGDEMIGQLLSHCPKGEDGVWPCEPVREAIEKISSEEIGVGMSIGIRNDRKGGVRKNGGAAERKTADQYRRWSQEIAYDHPRTSRLLEEIAQDFGDEAKWWDTQDSVQKRLRY